MKVACTVLRGGKFSNKVTYLNRPYAALLLLVIIISKLIILAYKVVDKT